MGRRKGKPLDPALVLEAYENTTTLDKAAARLGVTQATVSNILRKHYPWNVKNQTRHFMTVDAYGEPLLRMMKGKRR